MVSVSSTPRAEMRAGLLFASASAVALVAAFSAGAARATAPGVNGRIVFSSTRAPNVDVYVASMFGSVPGPYPLDIGASAADDVLPAAAPDGLKIAFVSRRDGYDAVYVNSRDS